MKKNILIIGITLMGLILVLNGNSWAERGGGDRHQKWDKPAKQAYNTNHSRGPVPGFRHHQPQHRPVPHFKRPDHYRAPYRFAPKYRHWPHRPFFPKRHYWRHHQGPGIKKNYWGIGSYAPEDEFSASALISNAGFAFSIGVRETN